MFGNFANKDPKKALDDADNVLNKGLMGALTKGFMGKDFVDQANAGIAAGRGAMAGMEQAQALMESGATATAEVLGIQDTGMMVNYNPVVVLTLKVTPADGGAEFHTAGQSMVSKIAVPRIGDKINIKYDPANPSQLVVV
jgi:hypothetical protein